ncbi:glycosyltransferase family 2 protein [Rubellimicrobium arenae]|uniref:glycosyltransferase family 2 protein n=1 Tax=Rubellimicrobium arenae TaxID=2817372 RepID=UPI001B30D1C1|nr:glycosyltransferase family 2 protein [Rubellimicrobium arenae]
MVQPGEERNLETDPDVSVLIISYNTRDLTCAALRSLAAGTTAPHEVIVVDNASEDGSASRIRQEFPGVRLMALPANIGFGPGNNLAAQASRAPYLLLLNPDTVVLPGAVDALLAFARRRPAARIWGGRTIFQDGRLNPTSCWRRMTLWSVICRSLGLSASWPASNLANPEAYPRFGRDHEREVDIVTGCFFLIERSLWDDLGGFDPAFFVYGEEADLCLRARAFGARPTFTPAATIVHLNGQSQQDGPREIQLFAARIRLARKHFPVWQQPIAVALIRLGAGSRYGLALALQAFQVKRPGFLLKKEVWASRAQWWNGYQGAGQGDQAGE